MVDKIGMIKEVRELSNLGLKESKELVEAYLAGDGETELMAMVKEKVKNRRPRSEEARGKIRDKVKGIKSLVEDLGDTCEGDFDVTDLSDIREIADTIINNTLTVRDRMTYNLEEILYEEGNR